MTVEDKGPHDDAHAAWLIDAGEPVYMLIGSLLTTELPVNGSKHHVLVGQGMTHPVQEHLVPLLEFFAVPRALSEARDWLAWAEAPADLLEVFVERGIFARVDTTSPLSAAESLAELRVAPECFAVEEGAGTDRYVGISSSPDGAPENFISPELAQALWADLGSGDIPSTVQRVAADSGQSQEVVARKILASAAELIEQKLIRVEWVTVDE
ncbi:hypothetical protein [Curtobacterium sp. MCSS17_016]|uniref:hypothetical protein n=1 Tax=Curtobacterium sp. MCSS17_016 TaxID=2175644 RepID=UPI000DA77B14|nr:hypothetical protein [Curtobacterium sp. MCSS17_016]WIE81025.1 hypothetical protein DEJ19_021145 [Curtobacterium sp. MCSS17_016]